MSTVCNSRIRRQSAHAELPTIHSDRHAQTNPSGAPTTTQLAGQPSKEGPKRLLHSEPTASIFVANGNSRKNGKAPHIAIDGLRSRKDAEGNTFGIQITLVSYYHRAGPSDMGSRSTKLTSATDLPDSKYLRSRCDFAVAIARQAQGVPICRCVPKLISAHLPIDGLAARGRSPRRRTGITRGQEAPVQDYTQAAQSPHRFLLRGTRASAKSGVRPRKDPGVNSPTHECTRRIEWRGDNADGMSPWLVCTQCGAAQQGRFRPAT